MKKTTVFQNAMLWFGAGISIAEILTGTYFAPLGFARGLTAILLGHLIGCFLLFLAGYIGARTGRSAMETVKMSFGRRGGLLFSLLNVLQLAGWTAIMIYDSALASDGVAHLGVWVWSLITGALIIVWILIGVTNLGPVNKVAMTALLLLTVLLCRVIFFGGSPAGSAAGGAISFGAALELAVTMPLSWLPLISDYTREAERPLAATAASAATYGAVSCWMYLIGMGAAIHTGGADIAAIMMKAGLGVLALVILALSTVTTTFMDAYSAGVSGQSLWGKLDSRWAGVAVTVIGVVCAGLFPMDNITGFLYLIGSVFAPMIAVQIADYFLLRRDSFALALDGKNLTVWAAGFVIYRVLMHLDPPIGSTLPDMAITMVLCLLIRRVGCRTEAPERRS